LLSRPHGLCPRKHVDYRASRIAPDFELRDVRRGYREGLRRHAGQAQTWSGDAVPEALRIVAGALVDLGPCRSRPVARGATPAAAEMRPRALTRTIQNRCRRR